MQVLLAMKANVEDRGIKGDCTPLMEAASGGYVDIVKLLIAHGADVNAQSSAGSWIILVIELLLIRTLLIWLCSGSVKTILLDT